MKPKMYSLFGVLLMLLAALVIAACAAAEPQTVEVEKVVTVEVEKEVEKIVTVEVEKEVEVEKIVEVEKEVEKIVEVAPEKEPVTLKFMNWSQEQADFYQELSADFNEEYPWITVEFETLVEDKFKETVPLMFQSGQAPDVFEFPGLGLLTMPQLLEQGWIRPLHTQGIPPEEWKARWPEGSFLEGVNQMNGVVYSHPRTDAIIWGPGYMFINNEVFAAAGLDPANPPQTWSELTEACHAVVDNTDSYCLSIPMKSASEIVRTWYPIAGSIGTSEFFDLKNGRYGIDSPESLEAFNFIQGIYNTEGMVVPGVNEKAFARQSMAEGQAAIYFGGAWMPSVWKTGMGYPDIDMTVAHLPYPDDGPQGAIGTSLADTSFFVSSQTQHPEEAWLLIDYLTRPEGKYASGFVGQGFGFLSFTDNVKWLDDPHLQVMAKMAVEEPFRAAQPMPILACPDAASSMAQIEANQYRQNWEVEAMVDALISGDDFAPIAAEIAETKNQIFLETLEEEAAAGLDVSADCFTFPDWEYDQNYDPANYANR